MTSVIISSGFKSMVLNLTMKSLTRTSLLPKTELSLTLASSMYNGPGVSPFGDAFAMFPAMVALFLRATAPILDAACLRCHGHRVLSAICALVQPDPMQHSPLSLMYMFLSSGRFLTIITGLSNFGVRPNVLLLETMRSLPPARTMTSCLDFISRASSSVFGM